jgi:hypothetical protein
MGYNIRMSLRGGKITFIVSITALLIAGFLATSLSSFTVSCKALRSEIRENELPLTSDNVYSEIQRDLIRPIIISSLMANDTFVRDWVLKGEKGDAQITKYLKEIQEKYGAVTSFFVSEKSRTYYHADNILKKVSPDEPRDNWYFRVRDMVRDYEINIDPDLANKDIMTVFINHRVFDYDGEFIGAIGVGLTVNAVLDLIEIYQAKFSRKVYFFDKSGKITMSGSGFDSSIKAVADFEQAALYMEAMNPEKESSFSYRDNGHMIHANIRYIEEWGWYLAVEKAESQATRGIVLALVISLVVCGVITVLVSMLVNASINRYQRRIAMLRGILPICSRCEKVKDADGEWCRIDSFVAKHTEAEFSHSICPDCMNRHYPDAKDEA